jgi:hypothetical protein
LKLWDWKNVDKPAKGTITLGAPVLSAKFAVRKLKLKSKKKKKLLNY